MTRPHQRLHAGTVALACLLAWAGCKPADLDTAPAGSAPAASAASLADAGTTSAPRPATFNVLFFEKETEWFHPSNPVADKAMLQVGSSLGWTMTSTKDSGIFTTEGLAKFDVVVFLMTSGMVLDLSQRSALQAFIASGRGYVGVHSASHTDYDSPYYNALVGASFKGHPALYQMSVIVEEPTNPIVALLPRLWSRTDEWYTFQERPETNPNLHILLSLDEDSNPAYPGATFPSWLRVGSHPLAWRQEYGGGRSFYTALGHTLESWADGAFLEHVALGIVWAGSGPHASGP